MSEVNAGLSVIVAALFCIYLLVRGRSTQPYRAAPGVVFRRVGGASRSQAPNIFSRRATAEVRGARLRGTARRGSTCRICGLRFDHPQHREHREGA